MKKNILNYKLFLITVVIITLAIFLLVIKISPSLNADDSPETVTAHYTLGIQHPPGYPLNTLLGKIFTMIPIGSVAFRSNLMSMLFHVLTAFAIYILVKNRIGMAQKDDDKYAAILASIIYLFCLTPFLQISSAKGGIYTLNAFFTVTIIYCVFSLNYGVKWLYLLFFVIGLSLANHWQSIVIILPALGGYCYFCRQKFTLHNILTASVLLLAGMSPYLLTFIRSSEHAVYLWGDIKSLKDLIWLVTMKHYNQGIKIYNAAFLVDAWKYYLHKLIMNEFPPFFIILFIPGFYFIFKKHKAKALALISSYILLVCGILIKSAPVIRFDTIWVMLPLLTSSYIFLTIFLSAGIVFLVKKIGSNFNKIKLKQPIAIITVVLFSLLLYLRLPDYSRYFLVYDYLHNIKKTLPEKAVYFAEGEINVFGSHYMRFVEKDNIFPVNTAILQYDWYRNLLKYNYGNEIILPEKADNCLQFLKDMMIMNADKEIYYSYIYTDSWQSFGFDLKGVVDRVKITNTVSDFNPELFNIYSFRGTADGSLKYDEFGDYGIVKSYGMIYRTFGNYYFLNKNANEAIKYYIKSNYYYIDYYSYLSLGKCYYNTGDIGNAQKMLYQAIKMNPGEAESYVYMACVKAAYKDYNSSMNYFDLALRIKPDDANILKFREHILKGKI